MTGAKSAVQRLDAALARIGSPDFEGAKVFTDVFADAARREAEAADLRLAAGRSIGPLDGCIVSVKALFDVAGRVTDAGCAALRGRPAASHDAPVVQRLRVAGAVVIGRTHMTELAFSAVGTNPHEEVPGNPHDRARVPGGSSSGAVVSILDGMAEIAIGSDTGGSIRIPAGLSGAVGFKPTSGRVPTEGAFSLSSTLDTVGPIALDVADCARADCVLAGRPAAEISPAEPGSFRLVVPRGRLFERTEPAVLDAFEQSLNLLRGLGISVMDGSIDPVLDELEAIDRIGRLTGVEVAETLRSLGITDLAGIDPKTCARIEAGMRMPAIDYVRMVRLREAAVRSFENHLGPGDILALPTTPIRAPLLAEMEEAAAFEDANALLLRNPRVANQLDCPSISLPLPVCGLPVGLLLIGRRNSDRFLFNVALLAEMALDAGQSGPP